VTNWRVCASVNDTSTFATVRLRQQVTKRLGSRVPYVTLIASFAAL
jgi:hypothetical protein